MVSNYSSLRSAAALLGLDAELLSDMLTKTCSGNAGPTTLDAPVLPSKAVAQLGAVVTTLYSKLVSRLLVTINDALDSESTQASPLGSLNLIDLPGFECFEEANGLEQLLFNYADEKLQSQTDSYLYSMDQLEFGLEGIEDDGPLPPPTNAVRSLSADSLSRYRASNRLLCCSHGSCCLSLLLYRWSWTP
jgi:myosin heavy subunit